VSFAKNYLAVGFQLDCVRSDGSLANYVPDFLVKSEGGAIYVIETKGREELDLPQKMTRLRQWCADATLASAAKDGPAYGFVYVDEESFKAHRPTTFQGLVETFREYQE
jgi:type III restriction enzyme